MDNPLHILITDPHLKGGGQVRYVSNLARQLAALGHQVTIGCKADSVLVERAREAGATANNGFRFRGGLRPRDWIGDLSTMADFIRTARPDVVHVNGSQDHWIGALANRWFAPSTCLVRTRHNTYPVKDHGANRILNRRWTDYQIVVCDVVRRTLAAQKAFDATRMCSIHNGVDAELFRCDREARASLRSEFGFGREDLVCGIAARLVPAKGHVFLFKAVGALKDAFPSIRLLVLGQGSLEDELKALAHDLGLDDQVVFAGFREDMHRCVQAFDIGVQPSIDCDTSSFSLKEAMAAEKPVVASDYGGLTEIIRADVDGFIVPKGTVEPLAEALKILLSNADLRRRMGVAGRERVLAEFTVQIFAQRTVAAYRRAIEVHRERTAHR